MTSVFTQRFASEIPLIEAGALAAMLGADPERQIQLAEHPYFKRIRAELAPAIERLPGGIGLIQIAGPMMNRPSPWELLLGAEDTAQLIALVDQAAGDESTKGILLDISSPGGSAVGGFDLADSVANAARRKPVVAWTGGVAASLAYLVATQASEIIASRSSTVGSVGAVLTVKTMAKMLENLGIKVETFTNKDATLKAAGSPFAELSEAHREHLQERVEKTGQMFIDYVRAARPGVDSAALRGQMFYGQEARTLGLVDGTGDRSWAVSRLMARVRTATVSPHR